VGDFTNNLEASLHKGFIDKEYEKAANYDPQFLVNIGQRRVLTSILEELEKSQSFMFSVAFITESGLAMLKSHLLDLKAKGIKGKILTSNYLYFNKPETFKELMKLTNVEVRITNVEGFHAKGYIFQHNSHYTLIVGSSNLTAKALKVNHEWNIKLHSLKNGDIVDQFVNEFVNIWEQSTPLNEAWIQSYKREYDLRKQTDPILHLAEAKNTYSQLDIQSVITPNKMQERALAEIQSVREADNSRSLVVSATGTGKTYLSAFDVRAFKPKRMLFVVHREQILKKAMNDYKKVLGGKDEDFEIIGGSVKQSNAKYVFAMIQTLAKDENLRGFEPSEFDYILIDEVHKAGAQSYLNVINYFTPEFMLGMTATPDRTDHYNLYELFDYNIAYEIRLQEALEEDMLCPFHYFGVTDIEVDGHVLEDATLAAKLVTEERVKHIIEKISYYGYSGQKLRGLIFCSQKEEAKALALALTTMGYLSVALTGETSALEREKQVKKLEDGDINYLITVDIFNEGIDIPSINQVVMLRQTKSNIIFIQQLGRGLRKHASKDYVTVIDFIGNYQNNYLIPIALSGDRSQNKDNVRRSVKDTSYISGVSTINFEYIAKQRIYNAIDATNLTKQTILKNAFEELKNRLGRAPWLKDFVDHRSVDPYVIANKNDNYYHFLLKMKEDIPVLSGYEQAVLTMISAEVLNGKRKHEIYLLDLLLERLAVTKQEYEALLNELGIYVDEETIRSVERIFDLSFFVDRDTLKYGNKPIVEMNDDSYSFNESVVTSLRNNSFFKEMLLDIVYSAKAKSGRYDKERPLTINQKYSRRDACKLLNWDNDESSTVYGYKTKHGTCPIFVDYHKAEDDEDSINYQEEFISRDIFQWSTKRNRKKTSPEVSTILNADQIGIDLHIFVKKDKAEGTDFYYLGKGTCQEETAIQTTIGEGADQKPIVHVNIQLEEPVEHHLYRYLIDVG